MEINWLLAKFDLSPSEIKAYLKLLDEGDMNIANLGKSVGVTRMAGYNAADGLVKKGLASYAEVDGKRRLVPETPEKLVSLMQEREKEMALDRARLEDALPELKSMYMFRAAKPQIKIYQGKGGLKSVFDDLIRSLKRNGSYVGYATMREELGELHLYFEDFKKQCEKHKINYRMIIPVEQERYERGVKPEHKDKFAYIANWEFPFSNEIFIYRDKVSIMSFKDQIGVIIESKKISETQRLIFELAWRGAQNQSHLSS